MTHTSIPGGRARAFMAAIVTMTAVAACENRVASDAGPVLTTPADALGDSPVIRIDSAATTRAPWVAEVAPKPSATAIAVPIPLAAGLPDELVKLEATLTVPVAGVSRGSLVDTYTAARGERVHEAIDIPAPRGTPVLSAADGRVLRLFNSKPGGLMIYATDPSERFILFYGHLDGYADGLQDGMPLVRGQVIGYVGTTGNAPADTPHLHFGILHGQPNVSWSVGVPVNPYLLLRGAGAGQH